MVNLLKLFVEDFLFVLGGTARKKRLLLIIECVELFDDLLETRLDFLVFPL